MKALITGGAGFIGSHLAEALFRQGYEVILLDNFSSGKWQNIQHLDTTVHEGDIRNLDTVMKAMNGCDVVFHAAALVSVPESIKHPDINHSINVTGAFNIFEAARLQNVKRVIYASSAAVYGNHPELPKTEASPIQPISPYATAKYINELYADNYASAYELTCVGLRYMNVYGPRQDPSSPYSGVLSIFCQQFLQGTPITIFGDGSQTRDFVFVKDVVQANILAATAELHTKSELFNIGTGTATSLNQIISKLNQHTEKQIKVNYKPSRDGDIKHSLSNIDKAAQQLGYEPKTTLSDGISATLEWFRDPHN